MPSNTRSRKSTNTGSKAKPNPKRKGKRNVQATEHPSSPTIAVGDKSQFNLSVPGWPPVTPPQRGLLPNVDTTPTRVRGDKSALTFNPNEIKANSNTDTPPQPSIDGLGLHEESVQSRLLEISQFADAAGKNFSDITASTPYNARTGAPSAKQQPAKLEGISLANSIGYAPTSHPSFIYQMGFAEDLDTADIESWLSSRASSKVYGKKWKKDKSPEFKKTHKNEVWNLPEVAEVEKELYAPFEDILNAIVNRFVQPKLNPGTERTVVDTHRSPLSHKETDTRTSPDFVVRGSGPHFELPPDGRETGYSNTVTFFDVKLDGQMKPAANLKQASVYSRQIFVHQPNRVFVRCLFFSERQAQLIQYDRAGAQYTPCIDLNAEPAAFVRIVVELCGAGSERQMGFDDSFHWTVVNGRKIEGYLRFGSPGQEKIYDLVDPHPISHSFDIRGSAMTVWDVEERGTGMRFVVRDTWAPDGRTAEHILLDVTKKVAGVSKMVDFHIRDMKASDYRCESTIGSFTDRQATRVITEPHGRRIESFEDPLEVLYALEDVLIGHYEVFVLNILHRNITSSTVFLGCEDAEVGWRGVLTGFEEALNFDPVTGDDTISKEPRFGTRFFQSCAILGFLTELSVGDAPPHDHTDDIESVFNLMCLLFFGSHPNGAKRDKKDKARNVIKGWDSDTPEDALAFKSLLFNSPFGHKAAATDIVTASWGPACGALFQAFLEWVCDIQQLKGAIVQKYREEQSEMKRREAIKQQKEMENRSKKQKQPGEWEGERVSDSDETDEEVGNQSLIGEEDIEADSSDLDEAEDGAWEQEHVEEEGDSDERDEGVGKQGLAREEDVESESDLDQAEDKAGEQEQVQGLAGTTTGIHVAEDDDNPLLDEGGDEELLDVLDYAPVRTKQGIRFKKGLFAPLMENGMVKKHYDTVINLFAMAATKIVMSPDQNRPPPVGPNRRAKRKHPDPDNGSRKKPRNE